MCSSSSCRSGSDALLPGALVAGALLLAAAGTAHSAPFPTRDQNPLLAGFGLPTAMPARIHAAERWSLAADLNWGSTSLLQAAPDEGLIVDAETRELRVGLQRSLGNGLALQLQVPYRYTGAGELDGFIDDWHDFFGLPEGDRSQLPANWLRIAYEREDNVLVDIDSPHSGLADITASLAFGLASSATTAAAAWISIKLPTGDADELTGSGATDASVVLSATHRFGERWEGFGQASVTWLGEGELLPAQQRSIVWSGMAGIAWRAVRGLHLKAQIDAHTAAFDSDLDFLGDAVLLTVGGDYRFESGWRLDMGVSEDIAVETSPDVVLIIGVRRDY
jgi:hypothetical protein